MAFCPEQGEEEEKAKHCDHKVIKRATCLADATFDASDKKIKVGNFWVDHQDIKTLELHLLVNLKKETFSPRLLMIALTLSTSKGI